MTYLGQSAIAENATMNQRVAQCAAEQGIPGPPDPSAPLPFGTVTTADQWTQQNRRIWAAAPGWADAWASALALHEDNPSYDPGKDEAVITDAMILGQVQAMTETP